jgi:HK97 family phage portal protein
MPTARATLGARLAASARRILAARTKPSPAVIPAQAGTQAARDVARADAVWASEAPAKSADAVWASEAPAKSADAVWASEAPNKKASRTGPLIAFEHLRRPVWTPRDYAAFAREGFMQNAIVYRCVRMIAECVAHVPLLVYHGDREIEDHPLLALIRRPNGHEAWPDFMQRLVGFLLVSGNAYVEAVALGEELRELHLLRPDRVKVVPGPDGWPEAFEYSAAGRSVRIAGEVVDGVRSVLHLKLFHPADDHYGLSPLEAAAAAIDLHNTASRWNKALLDNSARPSGAIVYTARDGNLTGEQIERLKAELEAGFQGSDNAGRPLLLEGGLDWKAMSLSPKDMDFVEARHVAAREIALALGVPPMLLGIPGDNTYSNLAEAQRSFWRATVLPLVAKLCNALSTWLGPAAGDPIEFRPDLDNLPALAPERDALWSALEKASFLSIAEKRALAGFSPAAAAGAAAEKFNPYHDALGRFTTAEGAGGGGTRVEPAAGR